MPGGGDEWEGGKDSEEEDGDRGDIREVKISLRGVWRNKIRGNGDRGWFKGRRGESFSYCQ